ncbi:MAG: phosphatase [Cytophagales bacterium]|nr:MAG: phosphatase [Cytophagales bacterium]
MIRYTQGNLLNAPTEALVNTVNTVGVMGKGIALQFKETYPKNYALYRAACKAGAFKTGEVLAVQDETATGQKWIINFPTKEHWKGRSEYEYIESGLKALRAKLVELAVNSVALPPLGCGNGGLDWEVVKPMIEAHLGDLAIDILLFEPNEVIKAALQQENAPKEVKLTPARAMLLYSLFAYENQGEQSSLFVANKLAYFLQRIGEKLRLTFEPHFYGPYSVQVGHVLYNLNGVYLNGMEQNQAGPFDPLYLNYQKWDEVKEYVNRELSAMQRERLEKLLRLINGFESAFSLELLATVDYLMKERGESTPKEDVRKQIEDWSSRKTKLFRTEYIEIAQSHLGAYANALLEVY